MAKPRRSPSVSASRCAPGGAGSDNDRPRLADQAGAGRVLRRRFAFSKEVPAMTTAVTRFPFVSKADILRAYRPGEDASDRTFRTLREHRLVSSGLAIRHRRQGRVAGQLRGYSALNIDVVILARHDQPSDALEAAAEAQRFEAEWEPTVKALAAELDLAGFDAFRTAQIGRAHVRTPAGVELERLHARLLDAIG